MSIISNLIFSLKKPRIIFLAGALQKETKEAVSQILKRKFKIDSDVFVFGEDFKNEEEIRFLIKKSSQTIIVVNNINEIIIDNDIVPGREISQEEKDKEIEKIGGIIKSFSNKVFLVLNIDDDIVKKLKNQKSDNILTFGFQERADFQATDIKIDEKMNFKINYMGNVVPIWLEKPYEKKYIYAVLAAIATGIIFGLNLVEISQNIKDCKL